jgi:hypothetical protein
MSRRDEKLFAIHDYFLKNESTSMLILVGKNYDEMVDIMMEVVYRNRSKLKQLKILSAPYPANKFSFSRFDDTLKLVYLCEMRSQYIDEMARDWNAIFLDFDQPKLYMG